MKDPIEFMQKNLAWLPRGIMSALERFLRKLPPVQRIIEAEYAKIMPELEAGAKPYQNMLDRNAELPDGGVARTRILNEMRKLKKLEEQRWQKGFVSGAVYHGDKAHVDFLNQVYALNSQVNPLHSDLWPSATRYEAEIVSMTAHMLGAGWTDDPEQQIAGTVTSGGTESILLAMKTYRDRARAERGVRYPNIVVPVTAHAAFDKASQYFNIKKITVPIDGDFRADVKRMRRAINDNTVCVVGSAVSFPHGVIDPIAELSEYARERNIGFHTDACLGGFILPWAQELGYPVAPFDFRLPGVTSMSCDTHKFGYASKGTSVVMYRGENLRHYQYYTITDWPGGMYFSPTFAGSRPGALSAACWAAMMSMGAKGYRDATARILKTAAEIKNGIQAIPELEILGDPLWVIAFRGRADSNIDIYRVMEFMTHRDWNLNGLHRPSCVHLCVTLRHTQSGVAKRFLKDLNAAIKYVRDNPRESGGMAPVYGMAATLPMRSVVGDLLKRYLDVLYRV